MDLKQSMAGTDIVTHYLEPFDRHKKYYDFMARAYDATYDYQSVSDSGYSAYAASVCYPEDTDCYANIMMAQADDATSSCLSKLPKNASENDKYCCLNCNNTKEGLDPCCTKKEGFGCPCKQDDPVLGPVLGGKTVYNPHTPGYGGNPVLPPDPFTAASQNLNKLADNIGKSADNFGKGLHDAAQSTQKTLGSGFGGLGGMMIPIIIIVVIIIILKRR